MPWTDPKTWVASEDVDFGEFNTHIRDNFNETAPGIASAAGRLIVTDGVNSIAERIPTEDYVATSETTTSGTYAALATAGPAVTVTTGTHALVLIHAQQSNNTAGNYAAMSVAVSGATTIAASDAWTSLFESTLADDRGPASGHILFDTLTAGSNTFTALYRVGGGTGNWQRRRLTVIPF